MNTSRKRFWAQGRCVVACFAVVCATQTAYSQDQPPMPPTSMPAGLPPVEDLPFIGSSTSVIPVELVDRPFERFVDLKLLGEAYLTRDAALMTDVALQLLEGERVLMRSHLGVKVGTVLDAAITVATDQHDKATLDRLSKVAEKIGDKSISERVTASRLLASQTRAEEPSPPLPDDEMTHEEVTEINHQMQVYERAKALGDVASLKKLQEELKEQAGKEGSLSEFLAKQVAEALSELPDADTDSGSVEALELLKKLSGPARGLDASRPVYLEQTSTGAFIVGAKPYQRDGKGNIYFHAPNAPPNYGLNMYTPEGNPTAVKYRFGLAMVSPDWQKGTDNKLYRPWVESNPDWCGKATWNPGTSQWDSVWIQTFQAPAFSLPVANNRTASALVAYEPVAVDLAALVAAGGGNFTYKEIAALKGGSKMTFASLVAAGGGNIIPPDSLVPVSIREKMITMPGGFTAANLVAAGGGNLTVRQMTRGNTNLKIYNPSGMVVSGGSNLQERLASIRDRIAAGEFLQYTVNVASDYKPLVNAGLTSTLLKGKLGTLVGNDGASYTLQGTGHFTNAKKFSSR